MHHWHTPYPRLHPDPLKTTPSPALQASPKGLCAMLPAVIPKQCNRGMTALTCIAGNAFCFENIQQYSGLKHTPRAESCHVSQNLQMPQHFCLVFAHVWDEPAMLLISHRHGAVPSSDPVNVPRRRTSMSEEHSPGNISQTASAERSLLSQQIRLNSETSLSQMSNGTAAHAVSPLEAAEPQVGSSRQSFPPLLVTKQESGSDRSSQLLNGALPASNGFLQQGPRLESFEEQPSAESQSHLQQSPSTQWQSLALPDARDQQVAQVQLFHNLSVLCHTLLIWVSVKV